MVDDETSTVDLRTEDDVLGRTPAGSVVAAPPAPAEDMGATSLILLRAARVVLVAFVMMLVWIVAVAPLAHVVTQERLEADLRAGLNMATVPVQTPAPAGTPLAFVEIESIGLRRVVLAGTTASVLADGPGHLRTSRLPGQSGTSVIIGRRSLFGGDFSDLAEVGKGDMITVTTGQGVAEYRVESVRRYPATAAEAFVAEGNSLLLMTAGSAFSASERVVVDAELVGDPFPSGQRPMQPSPGPSELGLDGERGGVASLVAWAQVWLAALAATVWMALRWRARSTWILSAPVHLALATVVAEHVARLLPPLL